jgi:hypothetical protein
MKIYVNASSELKSFNKDGSAPKANQFKKFNSGDRITLDNGIIIELNTGKILVDAKTGEIHYYLNVTLLLPDEESKTKYGYETYHVQYQKYTPEEFKKLYNYISSLSAEEAKKQMRLNSEERYR